MQRGGRLFNAFINNQQVLTSFDIFASAGGQYKAIDESFPLTVSAGSINIAFSSIVDNAKVNAIEIVPQASLLNSSSSRPGNPFLLRINTGGAYTDSSGNVWTADENYQGGSTYYNPQPISNTTDSRSIPD